MDSQRVARVYLWAVIALAAGFAVYFSIYSIERHHALRSSAFDLGIFDQLMWNLTHGRGLVYTLESVTNRWLVHQEPILYLIALPYLLLPRAETLLVIQALSVAASGIPLYLLARRWAGHRGWAGLLIVVAYFMSPSLEGVVVSDFHEVAPAPLFLLLALYWIEERRLGWGTAALVMALACKEDVALTVGAVGFAVALRRKDLRLYGLAVGVIGSAVYLTTLFFASSRLAAVQNLFMWRFPEWAWPPLRLLNTMWSDPLLVLSHIFSPTKLTYIAWLLIPFGLLPLLSPALLLMALPTVGINLFSTFPTHYAYDNWHYNATVAPFLAAGCGMVIGFALRRAHDSRLWKLGAALAITLLGAGSSLGHYLYGYTPLAADFSFPKGGEHYRVVRAAAALIPPEASVSAQSALVPHLSGREVIYEYPRGTESAEVIALDLSAPYYTLPNTAEYEASIERLFADPSLGLVFARDGVLVFQRDMPTTAALDDGFYTYMVREAPDADVVPLSISFGALELAGARFQLLRRGRIEGTLYWRVTGEATPALRPAIALGRAGGELVAIHLQDLPFRHKEWGWQEEKVYRLHTGVTVGDGPCGTSWVYYASVWDESNGLWLEPEVEGTRSTVERIIVDGREIPWVPLLTVKSCWGHLSIPGAPGDDQS
ncbi:MAG: DUF2079 domain-containing protein [Anaerolineae bacterium]|nr:DUF2079 domain-containing protein [Anaerolineae bacterium]